jgi:hypothetical protein
VQPELLLHLDELGLVRLVERHPHEAAGPFQVLADLAAVDVRDLLAVLVGDAVDEHGAPSAGAARIPIRVREREPGPVGPSV